ncbi:MAG: acetylglutamate kinase [Spirochaetota bacterium]|uniref:acetylglutamate kinase n=1 Tax=Gracilinema caldarium TaxID=215591 RepID=UPI0026EB57A5|nr:acetylglutamate kinase [Gracilinema caldarium]
MKEFTIGNEDRARVLIQALPYIQKFMGKTIVVKYGGNAMINHDLKAAVIQDVVLMACVGIRTVLVHGGGPEIEHMLKKIGKESRFVNGLRYTDEETMEIVQMVLAGKVNKDIVSLIQQAGGQALGICGLDGGLLQARKLQSPAGDLGLVGEISAVKTAVLDDVLSRGYIPVISTVAQGVDNAAGQTLNINADTAAAQIAAALGAEKLMLMTDVRGILRDVNDPDSLLQEIKRSELDRLIKEGTVSKGMIPKVDCCRVALDAGVKKAHIIDGRIPHALLLELFTDEGIGTQVVADGN